MFANISLRKQDTTKNKVKGQGKTPRAVGGGGTEDLPDGGADDHPELPALTHSSPLDMEPRG